MAFIKSAALIGLCALGTMSASTVGLAQGLGTASLVIGVAWPQGYMGLGGHLGQAIAKPSRAKAAPVRHRPRVQKARTAPAPAPVVTRHRDVTPLYLVSMSLDPTGLNIAGLR